MKRYKVRHYSRCRGRHFDLYTDTFEVSRETKTQLVIVNPHGNEMKFYKETLRAVGHDSDMGGNYLEEVEEVQESKHHYYACNVNEWRTDTDLLKLLQLMEVQKRSYNVYIVPLPEDAHYKIVFYAPQVEGAQLIYTKEV